MKRRPKSESSKSCHGRMSEEVLAALSLYLGKMGPICHFSRALPASIWGHCFEILVLLAFRAHKRGVTVIF